MCKTLETLRQMSIGLSCWEPELENHTFPIFLQKYMLQITVGKKTWLIQSKFMPLPRKIIIGEICWLLSAQHLTFLETAALFPQNSPSVAQSPRDTVLLTNPCLHGAIAAIIIWRRQWHSTPVLLPGKFHGQRGLEGCSPWGRWGSDTTERLHFHCSYGTMIYKIMRSYIQGTQILPEKRCIKWPRQEVSVMV